MLVADTQALATTAKLFRGFADPPRAENALQLATSSTDPALQELRNAEGLPRTCGTEFLARWPPDRST